MSQPAGLSEWALNRVDRRGPGPFDATRAR